MTIQKFANLLQNIKFDQDYSKLPLLYNTSSFDLLKHNLSLLTQTTSQNRAKLL